ncbi:Hint domain-containing protein [Litoreibacter ponti]|uniref:Hint domain-containing protein n=1 Tax=Litoreibacter ponti TaxID=1510457 RepID=A0A2T6BK38_9RHOB|nr:Hint domain-containing protein [Litoreibacter ponti]PTX56429.1 Hint domain-containing protein [Litoreibacter ponti]
MADYSFHTYAPDILQYDGGSNTFVLASSYDPSTDRNFVEYTDDDAVFNGFQEEGEDISDPNQVGTAYDDQGNVIASGQVYAAAFAVLEDAGGNQITIDRIEINGVHVGYVPSAPLTPGTSYTVVSSGAVNDNDGTTLNHSYYEANSVPCFDVETLIETPFGLRRAGNIRPGELVQTLDANPQPVVWVCKRLVELSPARPHDLPVLIPAGALGLARPARALVVSGQHRVLLGHPGQGAGLLPAQTLVPAKALVGRLPGVRLMRGRTRARWVHLVLKDHAILTANGAYAESLLMGPQALKSISPARQVRLRLLAASGLLSLTPRPARPLLPAAQAHRALAQKELL